MLMVKDIDVSTGVTRFSWVKDLGNLDLSLFPSRKVRVKSFIRMKLFAPFIPSLVSHIVILYS